MTDKKESKNIEVHGNVSAKTFYRYGGDFVHILCLTSTLLFAMATSSVTKDNPLFFDTEWTKVGFCVTNPDIHYWTSHDLCLYVDVIMTIVCTILYLIFRTTPGMDCANFYLRNVALGMLIHGHTGIWNYLDEEK